MVETSIKKKIRFGTAGWSFKDWEGVVYPRSMVGERLKHIAGFVDMVEINTSFYRPPNHRQAQGWLKQVEDHPDFKFSAKLWQKFTHERGPIEPLDVRNFIDGIEPLYEAGRFAALVFQFPWSFRKTEQNLLHIERLKHAFEKFPIAVEVRHASWNDPEFIEFLKERNIAFINIDQPAIRDTLRPTEHTTSDFSYVRLHGRNEEDWFRDDAGRNERYNYFYSLDELGEWIGRAKKMAKETDALYVVANNHFQGQAIANAIEMKYLTQGTPMKVPEEMFDKFPDLINIASNPPDQMNLFA